MNSNPQKPLIFCEQCLPMFNTKSEIMCHMKYNHQGTLNIFCPGKKVFSMVMTADFTQNKYYKINISVNIVKTFHIQNQYE